MKETFVHTQFNSEPTPGVKMSDELITEQTGYRSTKEIVEGMILAGQRLEDYRHGRLDSFLEDEYQEPIRRYEGDPVEEEEDIVRKLRYRSEKCQKDSKAEAGEKSVEDSAGSTTVQQAESELEEAKDSSKS